MRKNERFAAVLLLACVFTISFCSAIKASSEPNAVELVQAVREHVVIAEGFGLDDLDDKI